MSFYHACINSIASRGSFYVYADASVDMNLCIWLCTYPCNTLEGTNCFMLRVARKFHAKACSRHLLQVTGIIVRGVVSPVIGAEVYEGMWLYYRALNDPLPGSCCRSSFCHTTRGFCFRHGTRQHRIASAGSHGLRAEPQVQHWLSNL